MPLSHYELGFSILLFVFAKVSYKTIKQSQCIFGSNKISDIIGRSHKKLKLVALFVDLQGIQKKQQHSKTYLVLERRQFCAEFLL